MCDDTLTQHLYIFIVLTSKRNFKTLQSLLDIIDLDLSLYMDEEMIKSPASSVIYKLPTIKGNARPLRTFEDKNVFFS